MSCTPMFDLPGSYQLPRLSSLPSWRDAKRVAIDTETCDPDLKTLGPGVRRNGFIAGISFAIEDGPAAYLPIAHANGPLLPADQVWAYLRDQAKDFHGDLVGMNLPYDLDYLAESGVIFRNVHRFRDVANAAVLLDELQDSYSLESILERAHLQPKVETELQHALNVWCLRGKGDMWRLPARYVESYAIGDVTLPLELLRIQEKQLHEQGLEEIWDLECQVLPVTVKIRRRGVRIDTDRLEQVQTWARSEEESFLKQIRHTTGVRLGTEDLLKKEPLVQVLAAIGFQPPETPTGQPRVDARVLEAIDHDVAHWLLRAKKFHKMRTDFAGSIWKHLNKDGRIHATFRQLKGAPEGRSDDQGVAHGRFSSTDPNLQQQYNPEKEPEISGRWREIFLPDEGAMWAACDYSAQEPRLAVHYANLTGCAGAADLVAKYNENPRLDLHAETAKLCEEPFLALGMDEFSQRRKAAKVVLLGLFYGMGGAKLCATLGLPIAHKEIQGTMRPVAGPEGQALLDGFHKMVPWASQLSNQVKRRAKIAGFIRTLLGRKCRFSEMTVRKALNRLIQGSAADQGKKALVLADAAGYKIQIPVHDELCASVVGAEDAQGLAAIMEGAVQLSVPVIVDIGLGVNWGEAA